MFATDNKKDKENKTIDVSWPVLSLKEAIKQYQRLEDL